jgi:hypothetical protein
MLLMLTGCGRPNDSVTHTFPAKETSVSTSSVDLSDFKTDLQVHPAADKAIFEIEWLNKSDENVKLSFSSGQKFELVIYDPQGNEVYRYSKGKMFTQALEFNEIKSNEGVAYRDEWDYNSNVSRVESGSYRAVATVIPMSVNSVNIEKGTFKIEKTFQVPQPQSEKEEGQNLSFRNVKVAGEQGKYIVTGEARIFEAVYMYSVEDGHNVIIEETPAQLKEGAPAWSPFELEINISKMKLPKNGTLILHLYERSAKDGSIVNSYFAELEKF